jgi:hypothetical protein
MRMAPYHNYNPYAVQFLAFVPYVKKSEFKRVLSKDLTRPLIKKVEKPQKVDLYA